MNEEKMPIAKSRRIELTNKNNLPDIIVKAVSLDTYDGGTSDISVTTLTDSPQVRMLKKQNKVTPDVSDLLWAVMGTAIHTMLEFAEYENYEVKTIKQASDILSRHKQQKAADWMDKFVDQTFPEHINNKVIQEKRLHIEVDGMSISGKFDRYEIKEKLLTDFKSVSAWIWLNKEEQTKYIYQLSIYAYMLRQYGFEVDKARIVFIFRDWKSIEAIRNKDYPKAMAQELEIPLMSNEETEAYIKKRVQLHKLAEQGTQVDCTDKEMWSTADSFKIYKKKKGILGKKAIPNGIHTSYESALAFKNKVQVGLLDELVIKHIPSDRKRCSMYCSVNKFCPQYQEFINNKSKDTEL